MNTKQKGNTFERQVSKKLSLCLTNNEDEYGCWRTSASGATATINNYKKSKSLKQQSGDITQVVQKGIYKNLDDFFDKFFVECKALKKFDLTPPYNKEILDVINQLDYEKKQCNKFIFFILKRNNRDVLLFTDTDFLNLTCQAKYYFKDFNLRCYLFEDYINSTLVQ
jgi:hypothetical protein